MSLDIESTIEETSEINVVINKRKQIQRDLKNWKEILKPYTKADNSTAFKQLISALALFLMVSFIMVQLWNDSVIAVFLFAVLNGFLLCRIFIIQHDCGHQSFFSSKKLNNRIGFLCSLISTLPFEYWARIHNYHHAHTGQFEERSIGDIDFMTVNEYSNSSGFERLRYKLFRNVVILLTVVPIAYFVIQNRFPAVVKQRGRKFVLTQLKNNLVILFAYAAVGYFFGIQIIYAHLLSIYCFLVSSENIKV